jgi:conjugative transfer signal peptidase TraF
VTDLHPDVDSRRRGRSFPRVIIASGCVGLGLVGAVLVGRPPPLIIYNASASAPIGFYRVLLGDPIHRGDLVLATTPLSVRQLAAERGYLPESVPLVKRVAALDGDSVCVRNRAVFVDGRHVADQRVADRQSRPLPAWSGCRILGFGEFFLLMEGVPDSFDGRYFGLVQASAIVGKLAPMWLW